MREMQRQKDRREETMEGRLEQAGMLSLWKKGSAWHAVMSKVHGLLQGTIPPESQARHCGTCENDAGSKARIFIVLSNGVIVICSEEAWRELNYRPDRFWKRLHDRKHASTGLVAKLCKAAERLYPEWGGSGHSSENGIQSL